MGKQAMLLAVAAVGTALLVCAPGAAIAQPAYYKHDLKNCRFDNGIPMELIECESLRRYFADEEAKQSAQAARLARLTDDFDRQVADEKRQRTDTRAAAEKAHAEQLTAKEAEYRKWTAKAEADQRADQLREARVVSAMKGKCGADYQAPRIGMSIQRAKECISQSLTVTGQLNRKDGVVTTYRSGSGAYFHVMDDRIVAWGR